MPSATTRHRDRRCTRLRRHSWLTITGCDYTVLYKRPHLYRPLRLRVNRSRARRTRRQPGFSGHCTFQDCERHIRHLVWGSTLLAEVADTIRARYAPSDFNGLSCYGTGAEFVHALALPRPPPGSDAPARTLLQTIRRPATASLTDLSRVSHQRPAGVATFPYDGATCNRDDPVVQTRPCMRSSSRRATMCCQRNTGFRLCWAAMGVSEPGVSLALRIDA